MTKALSEGKAKSVPELYIVTAPNRKQGGEHVKSTGLETPGSRLQKSYRNRTMTFQHPFRTAAGCCTAPAELEGIGE